MRQIMFSLGITSLAVAALSMAQTYTPKPATALRAGDAQSGFISFGSAESAIISTLPLSQLEKLPTSEFLVEYTTTEKDYAAGYRYAVGCTGGQTDCGVPTREVTHFEPFSTAKAAIDWVNCWEGCGVSAFTGTILNGSVSSYPIQSGDIVSSISAAYPRVPKTFVRLLAVHPVTVSSETTTKEVPQPAVKETKTVYRLEKRP